MAKKCPREGTRVRFNANPAAMMLYRSGSPSAPRHGEEGSVTSIPVGRGSRTCMPGPGGGLVYVDWENAHTQGVFRNHLTNVRTGKTLAGARRRKRRR